MRRSATHGLLALVAFAAGLGPSACGGAPRGGPEAAFERVRLAVVLADAGRLYDALDLETRWAVDTVWQYQREMRQLVATFPPEAREREGRRTALGGDAADPRAFFVAWAATARPIDALGGGADGLGVLARIEPEGADAATAVTTTGRRLPLSRGPDGIWGWAGPREVFFAWRNEAANHVARLRESADLYRRAAP